MHSPPDPATHSNVMGDMEEPSARVLRTLVAPHAVPLALHGHWHRFMHRAWEHQGRVLHVVGAGRCYEHPDEGIMDNTFNVIVVRKDRITVCPYDWKHQTWWGPRFVEIPIKSPQ